MDTAADAYLDHVAQTAARKLRMPIAMINLIGADRQWSKAAHGIPFGHELPRDIAFCTHTILSPDHQTVIPDTTLDARLAANPLVTGAPGFRFYAGAPIVDTQGRALGALCVIDTAPRTFGPTEAETLQELADAVSARLEFYRSNTDLRESQAHYAAAADLSPHGAWTASPQGGPDGADGHWLALVGSPAADPSDPGADLGAGPEHDHAWIDWVHPDDLPPALAQWSEALGSGRNLDLEYRLRARDGGYRWFRARAAARRDATGHIMRWYGTVEDIHDKKMTDAALLESETRLRLALDVGRLRTWELDLASRRLTASDASVLGFGVQLGAEPSRYDEALARIHPDDQQRYGRELERAWLAGQELEIEYRSLWPDGTVHWIRITGRPTRDAAGRPVRLVGLSIDITEQRHAEEERQRAEVRIAYLAHHDALTGLANRRLFQGRLVEALAGARQDARVALLCLDLDDFKAINETMGNAVGDTLLQHAAERLKHCCRETQSVARYDSDGFVVLATGIGKDGEVNDLADRLLSSLATPVELRGRTMVLAGSMGIALAPDDADDPDQLLRNAETALRRTKGKARGSYRFFQPEMDKRLQDQAELRLSLRDALAHDEFRLVYQPLVNLQSGRVGSFEALIRWQHPLRGLVQPADFIPIAEETGLIVPIGRWALQEACRQAATWPAEIGVAVNVSAVQFGAGALEAQIDEALALSGLAPGRLELEVTETLLLQDDDANTRILRALRQRGIRTAMDDFGTGFSSLGYLRGFAFDKIKIDRCLVRDLPDSAGGDAIVHAIIALARSLGIAVTAEGVETQAQLDLLRAQNCAQVQGYLFSRPVPPEAVLELCERSFG